MGDRIRTDKQVKAGLGRESVISAAAKIANEQGLEALSMKRLAAQLGVQPPSLYNHIGSLAELKRELMLSGWRELEQRMLRSAAGIGGWEAFRAMCREFYRFAVGNCGVFNAMLWYNKYSDSEAMAATGELFTYFYRTMAGLNISRDTSEHLMRTIRGFLEGFALLVNNGAFGHSASIDESFELSLEVLIAGMKTLEEHGDNNT